MTVDIIFIFGTFCRKKGAKKQPEKRRLFAAAFSENALLEIQFFRREVPRHGVADHAEEKFAEHAPEEQQLDACGQGVGVQ